MLASIIPYSKLGCIVANVNTTYPFVFIEKNLGAGKPNTVDPIRLTVITDTPGTINTPSIGAWSSDRYFLAWINSATGYLRGAIKYQGSGNTLYSGPSNVLALSSYGSAASAWKIIGVGYSLVILWDSGTKKIWMVKFNASSPLTPNSIIEVSNGAHQPPASFNNLSAYAYSANGKWIVTVQYDNIYYSRFASYQVIGSVSTLVGVGNLHAEGYSGVRSVDGAVIRPAPSVLERLLLRLRQRSVFIPLRAQFQA
jgi:hypothetical protein